MELLDTCESFGFFFFRGAGSAARVSVSAESPAAACVFLWSVLWSGGEEFVDDDDDDDAAPEPVAGSAEATPCPMKTAAPIPSAAASPPIRPM